MGIPATSNYFDDMSKVTMPKSQGNKVVTLNNQGFMRLELDEFSERWVKDSSKSIYPFLELGAAYGHSSLKALDNGGKIIANDIDINHLAILRNKAKQQLRKNLYLNHSTFPDQTSFPESSIGGVLFCRLAHFFTNQSIEKSFTKIADWLAPGGKIYFIALSPYHYTLREKFLPIFKKRKKTGDQNPGYIDNMREFISKSEDKVPQFMNTFDEDTIEKLINLNTFTIKDLKLFDYTSNNSDGKGFVGLEIEKKI